jgi:hypothetical protein
MIKLYNENTNTLLGEITEAQLRFLEDNLVEESSTDRDYYINQITLDMLESAGGDPALMTLLRQALSDQEDMDIMWIVEDSNL